MLIHTEVLGEHGGKNKKEASAKQQHEKASSQSDDSSSAPDADYKDADHRRGDDGPLMLKRGAFGHVDWFNYTNGYGFIIEDGAPQGERLFVHSNSILKFLPLISCELHPGEKVEFDIMKGVKGKEAVAVTGIGGQKVGSRRLFGGPRRSGLSARGPRRLDSSPAQWRETNNGMKKLSIADSAKGKGGKKNSCESDTYSDSEESNDGTIKKNESKGEKGKAPGKENPRKKGNRPKRPRSGKQQGKGAATDSDAKEQKSK